MKTPALGRTKPHDEYDDVEGPPARTDMLERVLDHLDLFERRMAEAQRLLHAALDAEFAAVRLEVRQLAEAPAATQDDYAARVAAQLAELRTRGDAAYAQLQAFVGARASGGAASAAPAAPAIRLFPAHGDAYRDDEI